jgi:hypothetical protein
MRVTLPLRPVPRTPACPGFCVSGGCKSACFDRSCGRRAVSPEWRFPALPRGWGPAEVDGATHRGRTPGRGFERVQMSVAGGQIGLEALTGRGGPLPFERVQMDCGPGALGLSEPCPFGSFERVQMTPAFALCVARGPSAHRDSHRLIIGHSVAARPSRHGPMNAVSHTQLITGECLCHP